EGLALPLSFAKGCLQRMVLAFSASGFTWGLYVPGFLAFAAECLLLGLLGRRLFSSRAGLWAVTACSLSAFTFLRLRSLLSYSIFPCELLLMMYLTLKVRSFWPTLMVGFASAVMLLDYEAWIFGLAALGLAFLFQSADEGPAPKAWL